MLYKNDMVLLDN